MKLYSRSKGIEKVHRAKDEFRRAINSGYEHRAKACGTCDTPGACCLDEHFVNVRISRLEGEAIAAFVDALPPEQRSRVRKRVRSAIETYGLLEPGERQTYACPLYERGVGCLVHNAGKPAACIAHACYDRSEDVPPDELLENCELAIDDLNTKVFGGPQPWLPIPLAIDRHLSIPAFQNEPKHDPGEQPTADLVD